MSKSRSRPHVIFDCNVLLQSFVFPGGAAAACYRLFERGSIELVVSKAALAEIRKVLNYPHVRELAPDLGDDDISAFLERLAFRATLIRKVPHVIDYPRDPDDEIYLDLAVAARADFLVTRDKDLLSLMTTRSITGKEFRGRTHPLVILNPVEFVERIDQLATGGQ